MALGKTFLIMWLTLTSMVIVMVYRAGHISAEWAVTMFNWALVLPCMCALIKVAIPQWFTADQQAKRSITAHDARQRIAYWYANCLHEALFVLIAFSTFILLENKYQLAVWQGLLIAVSSLMAVYATILFHLARTR